MITARDLRGGIFIEMNGDLYVVIETQHVKRENRRAIVRTKLKNLRTGVITETGLRPEDTFEQAFINEKKMQYLYNDQALYHFMDRETFEQVAIPEKTVENTAKFLREGMDVKVAVYKEKAVGVTLEPFVNLKIKYTEPGIKGDTAKGGSKPATLETGAVIRVPLFINTGDLVKIDTRTGEYSGRA